MIFIKTLSVYEKLKNTNGYIDYSDNIEFEYRYKYNFISESSKRNYGNILLKSFIKKYNNEIETLEFPNTNYPLSAYMNSFVNSVRAMVSENIISKKWVEEYTKYIILNSSDKNEVQLALALGEYFLDDSLVNEVGRVFSKSGNYIAYSIGIIKRMENYNSFLFDIIKNSKGMIKFIAAENIEEIDMKITKYILTEGFKDEYYGEFMAGLAINLFNCSAFLMREDITEEEVNRFCCLFEEYFRNSGPLTFNGEIDFLDKLLYNVEKFGSSIEALYCIFAIREIVLQDDTIKIKEEDFTRDINAVASQSRFRKVLKKELEKAEFDFSDLTFMAEETSVEIPFKTVKKYLDKDINNKQTYSIVMESKSMSNKIETIKYFEKNFDFSDITGNMEGN